MHTAFNGMSQVNSSGENRKARVCMPTARNVTRKAFQCGLYEAQDVFQEIDDVDIIPLYPDRGFYAREKLHRRLLFHDVSKKLVYLNPGLRKVELKQDYDLFIAVCQTHWDFYYLSALRGWKDRCKTSVCWIDEMWVSELPHFKYWLHALSQFDYILVGLPGSVGPLSKAVGRPCHWIPGGVDTLRFCPYPNPPERVVDVYSIGRRQSGVHEALQGLAAKGSIFYLHDTIAGVNLEITDHRQHRDLIARTAQRSKYFTVARGRHDEEADGQVVIGYRYYEGSAAGTLLIGEEPNCKEFKQMFDWPDAVITIRNDGSDVIEKLSELERQPEKVAAIRRANVAGALSHHDWSYRWSEMLRIVGLEPSPKLVERQQYLKTLADSLVHQKEGSQASCF